MNREQRRALQFKSHQKEVKNIKIQLDLLNQIADMNIAQLIALRSQAKKQKKTKAGQ